MKVDKSVVLAGVCVLAAGAAQSQPTQVFSPAMSSVAPSISSTTAPTTASTRLQSSEDELRDAVKSATDSFLSQLSESPVNTTDTINQTLTPATLAPTRVIPPHQPPHREPPSIDFDNVDFGASMRTFVAYAGAIAGLGACAGVLVVAKRALTNFCQQRQLRSLDNPTPWQRLPKVTEDAPPPNEVCPICLSNLAEEAQEPIRIRQPDGKFIDKVYDYSCILADMRYRAKRQQPFKDPSNQQPYTQRDLCRDLSIKPVDACAHTGAETGVAENGVVAEPLDALEKGLALAPPVTDQLVDVPLESAANRESGIELGTPRRTSSIEV